MSKPLKQVVHFVNTSDLNNWLFKEINREYETDIKIVPQGTCSSTYLVVYWKEPLYTECNIPRQKPNLPRS